MHTAIQKALSDCVFGFQVPGIAGAGVSKVAMSSEQLQPDFPAPQIVC